MVRAFRTLALTALALLPALRLVALIGLELALTASLTLIGFLIALLVAAGRHLLLALQLRILLAHWIGISHRRTSHLERPL